MHSDGLNLGSFDFKGISQCFKLVEKGYFDEAKRNKCQIQAKKLFC